MSRVFILLLFCLIYQHDAAKILVVIPTPSISHQVPFRPLTQELARRGHEVTVLTADPAFTEGNSPPNLTEIDIHDVSYKISKKAFIEQEVVLGEKESIYQQISVMGSAIGTTCEVQMKTKEVASLMNNTINSFDLLLIEECAKPYMILSHIYKVPVIVISSVGILLGDESPFGAPEHVFLYPTSFQQSFFNLTFWEKVKEVYKYISIRYTWLSELEKNDENIQKLLGYRNGEIGDLNKNIDMVFLNIHPVWDNNRPLPPNVISIWGIHKKPEKALPNDLETYLNSSKNGVIYFSFGTNCPSSLLPAKKIQVFTKVFSELPYDVLWKWEGEVPGKSENIKISKWLPQSDLLRHPNVKLFITQGGLQSTDEAINAEVPLIGIPMLGDQWYNVEMYEHHRIGIKIDFDTINEDKLRKAITTVIGDKSYRENIKKLRSIMSDQPESALSRAVWWTEYVLRHGGAKHLRAAGANVSLTQYYEIELVLTLVGTVLLVTIVTIALLWKLYQKISLSVKIKTD